MRRWLGLAAALALGPALGARAQQITQQPLPVLRLPTVQTPGSPIPPPPLPRPATATATPTPAGTPPVAPPPAAPSPAVQVQTPAPPAPSPAAPPPPAPPVAAAPAPPLPNTWLPKQVAELMALDKVTARATPISVHVGQTANFGSLTIAVRGCAIRPPDQPADATAFLDITDANAATLQFHGWMILSAPAVSMLQHPIYDVRLAGCHE